MTLTFYKKVFEQVKEAKAEGKIKA